MTQSDALASWIDAALAKVVADLTRARALLADAMARLLVTFSRLRDQLAEERALFESTLEEVNGTTGNSGLVGVLRDVLSRFVDDMVRIGASSVKIMMEVEALRGHTQQVAASGLKIEQIAGTTRMLSLNARIEAQRIGSAGAVFRVVADEIKALAHQSAELSKTIRDALAVQSTSLANTGAAVSKLAASDLDHAVTSHKHLDDAIARLAEKSAGSLEILARVQTEADAALQALQFEDMLTQLLQSITEKLEVVRTACQRGTVDDLDDLDARVQRDSVTQHSLGAGSVELF
ncbi:MAG TPA: methyl-accepting chemotaxis protein [Kofleriaceae bacterium]|nr:methyl-accepting chemotaxis protein [Kofleriaceae bacterium]